MRGYRSFCLPFVAAVSLLTSSFAMPPHPELLERVAKGQQAVPYYLSHVAELRAAGVDEPEQTTTLSELRGASLDVEFPTLVILTDFSDNVSHVAATSFDNLLYGNQTGSVKNYYSQVTYGNLTIITLHLPSATGWQRAPQPYAYYVNNQNGFGAYPQNAQRMVEDVVNMVDPMVDFSQYDSNHDGYVDALFIVHAGRGAERSGNDADVWSHAWGTHTPPHVDGVWVTRYSMEPEYWNSYGDMTCGVFAHEMGHSVFGLPDLYDTDYSSKGLGIWSLMAGGSWNGTLGNSPAHPDAWCKIQMGLVTPTNITVDTVGITIPQIETTPKIYRLWTDGAAGSQYFLVENRQRAGYDATLPASGLLIYHIDDNISGYNNNEWYPGRAPGAHYRVALEQADGQWQLEHNTSSGGHGDPYPGSTNNPTFDAGSTPDSRTYTSATTNVAVRNISTSSSSMTADFTVRSCTPPSQVTGLTASTNRCSDVLLNWTDVSSAGGFRVFRNGSQIGSDLASHTTTYTDVSAVAGVSYSYTILAFQGNCTAPQSNSVSGMRVAGPATVTGVTATTTHCSDITIGWNDISGETGYRLFRNGVQIGGDLSANTVSYVDANATAGVSYSYIVVAFNATCTGSNSAAASGLRVVTPNQVTGVAATSNRCSDVQITWSDGSSESGYRVLRNGSQIGSDLAANATSYTDASAVEGVSFSYRVVAFNGACEGTQSLAASGLRVSPPGQVSGVGATTNRCSDVQVTWQTQNGVSGYRVYRNGAQVSGDLGSNTTTFYDIFAAQGVNYSYSVAGLSGTCVGQQSTGVSGMRAVTPAQVTGVAASNDRCSDVTVTWSDISIASGFRVFRNGVQIGNDQPAHTVSFVDLTPTPGTTYSYTVQAFTNTCDGVMSAAVNGMKIFAPVQVDGVIASTNRCTDVMIMWNALAGVSGYRVYRNSGVLSADLSPSTTTYYDTYAPPGLAYSYTVVAFIGACSGEQSAASSGMRAATPAQVTNVTASTNRCSDVRITWNDVASANGFRVFRNGLQLGNDLPAHTVMCLDSSAATGTSYNYTVCAVNGECTGALSSAASGERETPPAQVSNVTASTSRCSDVLVTWSDAGDETGYRVFRDGVQIGGDITANTLSFSDVTAAPGEQHFYSVQAFYGECSGQLSQAALGTRTITPSQVIGVSATTDRCAEVTLSWTADVYASGYRLYRDGAQIGVDLSANDTSIEDVTAVPGVEYSYTIVAFNDACESAVSEAVNGLRMLTPAQVTGVSATQNRCTDVTIQWPQSSGATGYRVYRDGIQQGVDLPPSAVSFSDVFAEPGHSYTYAVLAYNGDCFATLSASVMGVRTLSLPAVSGVAATDNRCSDITVNWNALGGADSFQIWRDGIRIAGVPPSVQNFVDITAQAGTHEYRVVAFNACGAGQTSGADFGTRASVPETVSGVTATTDRCSEVFLNWNSASLATGYSIIRNDVMIATLDASSASYEDLSAEPGEFYSYRVRSYNDCGDGVVSSSAGGYRQSAPPEVIVLSASGDRCDSVVVRWADVDGATQYRIYQDGFEIANEPVGTERVALVPSIGSHTYEIITENDCGASVPSVTVSGARWDSPGMPINVVASDEACGVVTLSWDIAGGYVEEYVISRDGLPLDSIHDQTYTDVTTGTHSYQVYARNSYCGDGPFSEMVQGVGNSALPPIVALTASTNSCSQIELSWTPVSDAEFYIVYRDEDSVGFVSGDVNIFSDDPPTSGSFEYTVTPMNACGPGEMSSPAMGVRLALPETVQILNASEQNCEGVYINWRDALNESSYVVFRDGELLASVSENGEVYLDTSAQAGVSYEYTVRAENECGAGNLSAPLMGMRQPIPAEVMGVEASSDRCDSVIVTWIGERSGALYVVLRDGAEIAEVPMDELRFADVPSSGDHTYSLMARNQCGSSEPSSPVVGTRLEQPGIPQEVSVSDSLCGGVRVVWAASTGQVNSYSILRDGILIGSVDSNVLEFLDLVNRGDYDYSVQARGACGDGEACTIVTGTSHDVPDPPESISLDVVSCDHVGIDWIATRADILQYYVYRDGVLFDSTDTIEFADTTLNNSTPHSYVITARDLYCGEGAPSEPVIGGLQPLTEFRHTLPDTISAEDSTRIVLDHCDGVSSDSLLLSINGSNFVYVAHASPVQSSFTVWIPGLETEFTENCRVMIISHRESRTDTLVSLPFVVHLPQIETASEEFELLPKVFVLDQNYPNPFNPSTTIRYSLPFDSDVSIEILDVLGRRVATLAEGTQTAGAHTLMWNGANNASGVYFLSMRAKDIVLRKKMVLLK